MRSFGGAAFTASLTAAGATNRDCDRSRGSNDPRHLRYQWIDTMADYQEVKSHLMKRAKRFIIINLKFSWSGPLSTLGGRAAIRTIWTTISYSFFDVIGPLMRRWGVFCASPNEYWSGASTNSLPITGVATLSIPQKIIFPDFPDKKIIWRAFQTFRTRLATIALSVQNIDLLAQYSDFQMNRAGLQVSQ